MSLEDDVAAGARREIIEQQEKVREFEGLLDSEGVEEPTRFVLRQWVEEHLVGPVLEIYEKRLRGSQGKN